MRKWTQLLALACCTSGSIAPGIALAESIQKADQKDLARLLGLANQMTSVYAASLIGETGDRVYIEYQTGIHSSSLFSSKLKRVVYWIPRSEITDGQLTQFRTARDKHRYIGAFKRGMTQGEASAAITSLGFESRTVVNRPAGGWVERDGTAENLQGRASSTEQTQQSRQVLVVERYAVGLGLAGTGTVYLFFGSDGRLMEHYLIPNDN